MSQPTKVGPVSKLRPQSGRGRQSVILRWPWRQALTLTLVIMGAQLLAAPLPAKVLTSQNVYVSTDSLLTGEWTLVYFYRGYW